MKLSAIFYCLLLSLVTGSCNRYIDTVTKEKKIPIMQGDFTFYPDSSILIFKSNVGLRRDNEISNPRSFYVKLPKRLKWYEISNSSFFEFYYDKGQVIAINIDLSSAISNQDTAYVPNQSELHKFIMADPSSKGKYDIKEIELKADRKQLIIKKDAATILLYNVMPDNYDLFIDQVNSFKFL
jgi:hypothetical protein